MLKFINSYPESGGQWAGHLVGAYLAAARDELPSGDPLPSDADPGPYHQAAPLPTNKLGFGRQVQVRSAAMFGLECSDRPSVVTSHHAAVVHQGISLFSTFYTDRVVIVVRDPRDVVVSLAERNEVSLAEAVEVTADRERVIQHDSKVAHAVSSWHTHVATWLKYDAAPTRFYRYEDLRSDPDETLTKMIGFLALDEAVDQSCVQTAVEAASFERIESLHEEAAAAEQVPDHLRMCRCGEIGAWKDQLSEDHIRQIERVHGKLMKAAGYQPLFEGELERSAPEAPDSGEPHMTMEKPEGAAADTGLGAEPAKEAAPAG